MSLNTINHTELVENAELTDGCTQEYLDEMLRFACLGTKPLMALWGVESFSDQCTLIGQLLKIGASEEVIKNTQINFIIKRIVTSNSHSKDLIHFVKQFAISMAGTIPTTYLLEELLEGLVDSLLTNVSSEDIDQHSTLLIEKMSPPFESIGKTLKLFENARILFHYKDKINAIRANHDLIPLDFSQSKLSKFLRLLTQCIDVKKHGHVREFFQPNPDYWRIAMEEAVRISHQTVKSNTPKANLAPRPYYNILTLAHDILGDELFLIVPEYYQRLAEYNKSSGYSIKDQFLNIIQSPTPTLSAYEYQSITYSLLHYYNEAPFSVQDKIQNPEIKQHAMTMTVNTLEKAKTHNN